MRYIALVTKISDFWLKNFIKSEYSETKEAFIERIYKQYDIRYYYIEFYELGKEVTR